MVNHPSECMTSDAGEDKAVRIPYATMRWMIGCFCCLALLAGCDTLPDAVEPAPRSAQGGDAAGLPAPPPPAPATIQPGDRLALRTRTAGAAGERTLIAFVEPDGQVTFDGIGVFDTRDTTVRAVEQAVLQSINRNGSLVATARLAHAPLSDVGLFVAIDQPTFGRVLMDRAALERISAGLDARWQWVRVTDLAYARVLPTVVRDGSRWTLAQPAHAKLVGDELIAGVTAVTESHIAAGGYYGLTLRLHPATALALEHADAAHSSQPFLAVLDGRLIALARVTPPSHELTIRCGDQTVITRLRAVLQPTVSAANQQTQ